MEINQTISGIITILLNTNEYLRTAELAAKLGMSERTVRYYVEKLDTFLTQRDLTFIKRKFNQGIMIEKTQESVNYFKNLIENQSYKYKFSKDERHAIEIMLIILEEEIDVNELANEVSFTKNTIVNDISEINNLLSTMNLKIYSENKGNLKIKGIEEDVRQLFYNTFWGTINFVDIIQVLNKEKIQNPVSKLILSTISRKIDFESLILIINEVEKSLDLKYIDESFSHLIINVALSVIRFNSKNVINNYNLSSDIRISPLAKSLLKLFNNVDNSVTRGEIKYLEQFFLAANILYSDSEMLPFHNEDINVLKEIIEKMVIEFELEYNIQLQEYRDDLKNGLLVHIVPMINRLRYGIEIINPIYFDIVIRHRDVYDSTRVISRVLEDYFNININNHEISFIAVYFLGALFKLAPVSSNLKQIIIVCSAGYGTSQLVATQIEKSFNVDILDVISYQEVIASLKKYENVDYIVSTVDIPVLDRNSYLVINPIIADEDYSKLKEVFEERQTDILVGKTKINLAQNLASIAIDYGVNIDKSQLEYDFLIEIIKAYDTPPLYTNCFEPNLVDVIKKELITFDVESSDWQESIIKSCSKLERYNYVNEHYKHNIINDIMDYGPNLVMFPNVAIAHSRIDAGCLKLGFSFTKLKNPVSFGHPYFDPVSIIFTLSVIDKKTHQTSLLQLFKLLSNAESYNELMNANNKEELIQIFKESENLRGMYE